MECSKCPAKTNICECGPDNACKDFLNKLVAYVKEAQNTSTNNARAKCPHCGEELFITGTSPVA
jgi:hypothetical protein